MHFAGCQLVEAAVNVDLDLLHTPIFRKTLLQGLKGVQRINCRTLILVDVKHLVDVREPELIEDVSDAWMVGVVFQELFVGNTGLEIFFSKEMCLGDFQLCEGVQLW